MDDTNDDDITPSMPVPRSVALLRLPQPLGRSTGGTLASDKASSRYTASSSHNNNNSTKQRLVVKQDHENEPGQKAAAIPKENSNYSWMWKVTELPTVPIFHPLECTSVLLKDIPLDEITARVSGFMRLNSICCSYQSTMGHVDCLTSCLLKFSVQLWQSPEPLPPPKNDSAAAVANVIIEISRLQGCAIGMQRLRNGLLYAVMTGVQPDLHQQRMASKCPSRVLRDMYEQYVERTGGAPERSHCKGAFLIAIQLLASECVDQNKLGMESLAVLTNPTTVCESEADWIAKAIVFGEGEFGTQIQSVLTKYFQKTERPEHSVRGGGLNYDSGEESAFLQYAQGCTFGMMHNYALQVLTHSLDRLVTRKSDNSDYYETIDTSCKFWKTALPALMYDMKVAQHRPHEATLSARSMGFLDHLEPMFLEYLMEDRLLLTVAQDAYEFGKKHHLSLERESGNLITSLRTIEVMQTQQPTTTT